MITNLAAIKNSVNNVNKSRKKRKEEKKSHKEQAYRPHARENSKS